MAFTLFEIDNAPAEAKHDLENTQKQIGFIPNLFKLLAGAPPVLKAYRFLHDAFEATSFNKTELTVVWQTINKYHNCHYCLPGHTGLAIFWKVDQQIIDDLYDGKTLKDPKLAALQATTRELVDQRGHLSDTQKRAFFEAGYSEQQLLEILVGVAHKVISNFANSLADTPVDEGSKKFVR